VPILPESAGYGIVLGFGIFFSIFTTTLVRPRCPKFQQTSRTVTLRGFPKRFLDFPRKTYTQGFRVRSASDFSRNRFVMSTRQRVERKLYFVRATIFSFLRRRSSDGKKTLPH